MESAARAALNQFRALAARRGRAAAAATARTFPIAARVRHMSATGSKGSGSSSPDERAVIADRAATAASSARPIGPPAKPRVHIVWLKPADDDVDESKVAELHHGILSSVVGSEDEARRCMVAGYTYSNWFAAMITDSQARAISDLPGVLGVNPSINYSLITPNMETEADRERRVSARNAAPLLGGGGVVILNDTSSVHLRWKLMMKQYNHHGGTVVTGCTAQAAKAI